MKTVFRLSSPCVRAAAIVSVWLASLAIGRASNVLSNTGQSTEDVTSVNVDGPGWLAQSFITGTTNLQVNSVTLELGNASGEPGAALAASIYTNTSGLPGAPLGTEPLTASVDFPTAAGSYVYSAPGGLILDPNTEYWVVASTTSLGDSGSYAWNWTASSSVDNPGSPANTDATFGWSLDLTNTVSESTDQGASWTPATSGDPQQFYISAVPPVPEPQTWAMLGMGGAFLFCLTTRKKRKAQAHAGHGG